LAQAKSEKKWWYRDLGASRDYDLGPYQQTKREYEVDGQCQQRNDEHLEISEVKNSHVVLN